MKNQTTENKIQPLFLENPFEKKLNQLEIKNSKSQNQSKLEKMFTPKTFAERWKFVNTAAVIVGLICNYFSFVTAFALIFYLFFISLSPITGTFCAVIVSLFPSGALTISIELVKRHASANFLQDAIQFKKIRGGMFAFLAMCCLFSILTSYFGAKEIPKHIGEGKSQKHYLALYKIDSVSNAASLQYDKEISDQKGRIDTFVITNSNSKGSIRYGALETQEILQAELTRLKEKKQYALDKISRQYNRDKEEALALDKAQQEADQKESTKTSDALALAAILSELLFLFCMIGNWWYCWKSYQELHVEHNEIHNDISIDDNRHEIETPESPGPRTSEIGFRKYNDNDNDNRKDDNRKDSIKLPICGNCSKEFLPKHHKQIYCEENCKTQAWELRTGKKFIPKKANP